MSHAENLVNKYFRHNFLCHFADGICWNVGITLIGTNTILAGLINQIAQQHREIFPVQNQVITILGIAFSGLPQIFSVLFINTFESRSIRKPLFLLFVFISRFSFVAITLVTIFVQQLGGWLFVSGVFLAFLLYAMADGAALTQWFDFIGSQIPARQRGRLFGLRDSAGTVLGLAIIAIFPFVTHTVPFPYNFGILFAIATVFQFGSWFSLCFMKEIPYHPDDLPPQIPLLTQLQQTFSILREDKAFRRLMIGFSSIALLGITPVSLITMKAVQVMHVDKAREMQFTSFLAIFLTAGFSLALPVLGFIGDRIGYKLLTMGTLMLTAGYLILGLCARHILAFDITLVLAGVTLAGSSLTWMNYPLEFAPEHRRPSYMGLRALCALPFIAVPWVGGWLADTRGYNFLFLLTIGLTVIAFLIFAYIVDEPRNRLKKAEFFP